MKNNLTSREKRAKVKVGRSEALKRTMATKVELGDSREDLFSKTHLPSYAELHKEKLKRPLIYSALLTFPKSEKEINYNLCVKLDNNGNPKLWVRIEPDDSEAENSVIRELEMRKNRFVITDEIQNVQDPHTSNINANLSTLGAVGINCSNPYRPGKVTDFHEVFFPIKNGNVKKSDFVSCQSGEKDVRISYVGNGKSLILTRQRNESEEGVDSYLQGLLLPSPKSVVDITKMIDIVKKVPSSRIDLLQKENIQWFGSNFSVPLVSPNGIVPVGLFSHVGRYNREIKCKNGDVQREYVTLASEHIFDPKSGRVIKSERPKIVSTAYDFKDLNIKPKKEGLENVVFMGSPIFVIGESPMPEYIIIFTGVKDGASCLSVIKYPFTLPPDPILNKDYTMSKLQAKKFLYTLEQLN